MPLALLLQETTAAFRYGGVALMPWNHLVWVEELLIDRARSAFLYKWFGLGLPLHGFRLRVVIANIDALRQRYLKVKEEVRQRALDPNLQGPNLLETTYGMAGVAAGMVLTPGVAIGSAIAIVRSMQWHASTFGEVLKEIGFRILILFGSLFGGVVVALSPALAAGSFVGYLQMGLANAPELRAFYDLLGGLARLFAAATRFIKLVLGPRSEVKNSILAGLLHLFDQLARVFPFGLALVAVFVTRFGPLLLPMAATIESLGNLIITIWTTLIFIWSDFIDQFMAVFTGSDNIVSPLQFVLGGLMAAFSRVVPTFTALLEKATHVLEAWYLDVRKKVIDWGKSLGDNLHNLLKKDPTWVQADLLLEAFKIAGMMLSLKSTEPSTGSKPSPFDPWTAQAKKWNVRMEQVIRETPVLPKNVMPGDIIELLDLKGKFGIPKDLEEYKKKQEEAAGGLPKVSKAVVQYVERARHPVSALAYEKKALAASYVAKTLPEALAKAKAEEKDLRHAMEAIVGHVLPPELRHAIIPLVKTFAKFDELITLDKKDDAKQKSKTGEAAKPEFPVKDLPPDNGLLRPVVQRLVLRATSGRREDLQDFMKQLQDKLNRPYPASI